jgi:DNA-binding winged helix-turn-helix (wHTH) protein
MSVEREASLNVTPPRLRFGSFSLDVGSRSLEVNGQEAALRPQAMEVLCYLAQNPGRPIPKEEFFRQVWPGIVVTDDSLVQCIGDIRRVLGDDDHRIVKTVPRRGYLFAGAIAQEGRALSAAAGESHSKDGRPRTWEIKLAVMVATAILAVWAVVHWFVSH